MGEIVPREGFVYTIDENKGQIVQHLAMIWSKNAVLHEGKRVLEIESTCWITFESAAEVARRRLNTLIKNTENTLQVYLERFRRLILQEQEYRTTQEASSDVS